MNSLIRLQTHRTRAVLCATAGFYSGCCSGWVFSLVSRNTHRSSQNSSIRLILRAQGVATVMLQIRTRLRGCVSLYVCIADKWSHVHSQDPSGIISARSVHARNVFPVPHEIENNKPRARKTFQELSYVMLGLLFWVRMSNSFQNCTPRRRNFCCNSRWKQDCNTRDRAPPRINLDPTSCMLIG